MSWSSNHFCKRSFSEMFGFRNIWKGNSKVVKTSWFHALKFFWKMTSNLHQLQFLYTLCSWLLDSTFLASWNLLVNCGIYGSSSIEQFLESKSNILMLLNKHFNWFWTVSNWFQSVYSKHWNGGRRPPRAKCLQKF